MDLAPLFTAHLQSALGPSALQQRFLLAVSGGLDSMCLLEMARACRPTLSIAVAHFNHATRGAESDEDALFVKDTCESGAIPFFSQTRQDLRRCDEASLRDDRLAFLESVARQNGYESILTAHHLDDQLETLLMRLIRGTGLEGLRGIPVRRGPWVRPLLSFSRAQLEEYAAAKKIAYRHDPSNESPAYFRNRVRNELVPIIRELSEPFGGGQKFLERIQGLAEEVRDSEETLNDQSRSLAAHLFCLTPFWLRLNIPLFLKASVFWQQRLLRDGLKRLGVETQGRSDCERLRLAVISNIPAMSFHGFRMKQSCGYAYFQTHEQAEYAARPRRIQVQGHYADFPEIETRLSAPPAGHEFRFYQAGDTKNGGKLKDFFLTHRIPQPERRLIPLLVRAGTSQVVWVFPEPSEIVRIECAPFPFAASLRSLGNTIGP
jgi:tRNA(Ile)-lysidine synthetase-like protein